MKITNQQLRQIIKEELEIVLEMWDKIPKQRDWQGSKAFMDRQNREFGPRKKGEAYRGTWGGGVESIEQDPNIPPEHKEKLIKLFKSGPEGRKQALELMDTLGYGVEPHLEPDPYRDPPQNFADAFNRSSKIHSID